MKTVFELHFEKQMILSISEKVCTAQRRADLFYEFYKNGSIYYEELCDALYMLSIGEERGFLFLTPAGKPYVSYREHSPEDKKLFSHEEIPAFRSDLYDQLFFFMQRFLEIKKSTCPQNCLLTMAVQCDTI